MTNEEALIALKERYADKSWIDILDQIQDTSVWQKAIEALEKQVPKKPIKREIDGVDAHLCECGELIYPSEYFCDYCGQAIDWGEDENTL